MKQASEHTTAEQTDKYGRPKREQLAAAYEEADGNVAETARILDADACYWTVRVWLINHEIHQPKKQQEESLAARLEAASADDLLGGGSA